MFYKRLFQEKAMSVSDAVKNNYSLLITKGNDDRLYFILYDSKVIKKVKFTNDEFDDASFDIDSVDKSIIAMIKIEKKKGIPKIAYCIVESAARPNTGAGVLLYDIVLSFLSKSSKGLVPDRDSVSKSAQKVWKYYFNNRIDVEHIPIDDVNEDTYPITKDKSDDGVTNQNIKDYDYNKRGFLNHIYKIKKPINYSKLITNNDDFFIKNKKKINIKSIKQNLTDSANNLFIKLYN